MNRPRTRTIRHAYRRAIKRTRHRTWIGVFVAIVFGSPLLLVAILAARVLGPPRTSVILPPADDGVSVDDPENN